MRGEFWAGEAVLGGGCGRCLLAQQHPWVPGAGGVLLVLFFWLQSSLISCKVTESVLVGF